MKHKIYLMLVACCLFAGTALAQSLPNYYPDKGFQRTGTVDAVNVERQSIVINDQLMSLSGNVIVHAPNAYAVPATRLTKGTRVGYKLSQNGSLIVELWILPSGYRERRR